jgi:CheY-like chemotaxis protein
MIRILVTDMLGELGHTIAAEAGHIDQALEPAKSAEFDLAILDVNLRGKLITPVAEMIRAPPIFKHPLPQDLRERTMTR